MPAEMTLEREIQREGERAPGNFFFFFFRKGVGARIIKRFSARVEARSFRGV